MSETAGLPWPQITLPVAVDQADATEEAFFRAGALSVTYLDERNEPILEPAPGEVRLWGNLLLVALFEQNTSSEELLNRVCSALEVDDISADVLKLVPDQQWERAWMDQFHPMQFGQRLWICPTHMEPVEQDAVNLRLDPGLAFGTGTHATTALCLQWLEGESLENKKVIDFGCGSGVLGIAALMLGAQSVLATDIDPLAIQVSQENATLNGVMGKLQLASALELKGHMSDILIANILYQPLFELKNSFADLLIDGGVIVMSGILEHQVPAIKAHYMDVFEIDTVEYNDGWARVSGKRIDRAFD